MPLTHSTSVIGYDENNEKMILDDDCDGGVVTDSMFELEEIDDDKIGQARMTMELHAANLMKHVDKVIKASRETKAITTKTSSISTSKLVLKILRAAAIVDSHSDSNRYNRTDDRSNASEPSQYSTPNGTNAAVADTRTSPLPSSLSINGSIGFDDEDGFECDIWSTGQHSWQYDEQKDNYPDMLTGLNNSYGQGGSSCVAPIRSKVFDDPFCLSSSQHTSRSMSFEQQQSLYLRDALVRCITAAISLQKNSDLKISRLEIDNTYLRQQLAIEQSVNSKLTVSNLLLRRRLQQAMKNNQSTAATKLTPTAAETDETPTQTSDAIKMERSDCDSTRLRHHQHRVFDETDIALEEQMKCILASRDQAVRESTEIKKLLLSTCFECRQKLPIRGKKVQSKFDSSTGVRIDDKTFTRSDPYQVQDLDFKEDSSVDSDRLVATRHNNMSTAMIGDGLGNTSQRKLSISTSFYVRKGMKDPLSTMSHSMSARKLTRNSSSRQDLLGKCPPTLSTSSRNLSFQYSSSHGTRSSTNNNSLRSSRTLGGVTKSATITRPTSSHQINDMGSSCTIERAKSTPRMRSEAMQISKQRSPPATTETKQSKEKQLERKTVEPSLNLLVTDANACNNKSIEQVNPGNTIFASKDNNNNDRIDCDISIPAVGGNLLDTCLFNFCNDSTLENKIDTTEKSTVLTSTATIGKSMSTELDRDTSPMQKRMSHLRTNKHKGKIIGDEDTIATSRLNTSTVMIERNRKLQNRSSVRQLRDRSKRENTGSWRHQFQASVFGPTEGDATIQ